MTEGKRMVAISTAIIIGLASAGLGIGGTLLATKGGDSDTSVTIDDKADVEEQETNQDAIATETQAEVCKAGEHFDAVSCLTLDLCQASQADRTQLAGPCTTATHDVLIRERARFCKGFEGYGFRDAAECRQAFRETT